MTVDRAGTKKVLSKAWHDIWRVAWRPDGDEVWFTAAERAQYKALRAVTLDGRARIVARMLGQVDLCDIARDGRVLVSQVDFRAELMARPPGATAERTLTWLGLSVTPDLSADGRHVLFSELQLGGGTGEFAYLRSTDGAPAVRLGDGSTLALSPDGKWALTSLDADTKLSVLPTGAGDARELTRAGFDYAGRIQSAAIRWGGWFPDSRRVMFNASEHRGPVRLYVQDIEGGEPRAVGPPEAVGYGISPDGRHFVAQRPGEPPSIYPVDGGNPTPCKGFQQGELAVRWTQDGRSLITRLGQGLSTDVSVIDIATGRRTHLWRLAASDPAGASFPIGIAVTPDTKGYAYSFLRVIEDLYLVEGLK